MKIKIVFYSIFIFLCACQGATKQVTPLADSPTSIVQDADAKFELPVVVRDTAVYKNAYKSSGIVRTVSINDPVLGEGCVTTHGYSDDAKWLEGVFLMTEDGYLLVRDWTGEYVSGVCE